MTAAEGDCSERRVSYSKPCHNDPDPCGLKSGWEGDEYCLKPPAEGEGIQIHFGPKSFTDMAEVNKYVIQPGDEFNNSVLARINGLTETKYWQRVTVQMRPGSHHWISMGGPPNGQEGFYPDTGCGENSVFGPGGFGGGQNLIYDNPPMGIPAPENAGLGRPITPGTACIGLHAYNLSDKPKMREIWVNLYFIDRAKITQNTGAVSMVGALGLNLPPGQKQTLTYTGRFSGAGRVIQLFGHRHKWTPRFAAWVNDELVYDSHDWKESVTFNYDSITKNPPINTDAKVDGAKSGMVEFKAGDTLKFSCFIENESMEVLRFKNELEGGEMCNMWGTTVGGNVSGSFP